MVLAAAPIVGSTIASGATAAGAGSFLSSLGGAAGLGQLMSGASSLLGGLFGGGKSKGPSLRDQAELGLWYERHRPEALMKGAEMAGIHPLVAFGISPGGGPSFQIGGQDGPTMADRMEQMGQGISRAASAFVPRSQRQMMEASARLSLENQALQNDRLRSEIALMHAPGTPAGMDDPRYPGRKDLPLGIDASSPRWLPLVNPDGTTTRVLNPAGGDNELLMAYDFLAATLPDELRNATTRTGKNILRKAEAMVRMLKSRGYQKHVR